MRLPLALSTAVYFVNDILSAQQTVNNGDVIKVQHRSVNSFNSTTTSILMIGDISSTFTSVTTRQQDFAPATFSFITHKLGLQTGTILTSNPATITEIDSTTTIGIIGGSYTINNGNELATTSIIAKGDLVRVVVLSSAQFNTPASAVLEVGGVTASFVVTTRAQDFEPATFSFIAQTGVETGTIFTSNPATITEIDSTTTINIVGGSYTINGIETTQTIISNNSTVLSTPIKQCAI